MALRQRTTEDARLRIVRGDANDLDALCDAMTGHDIVIHLASNPKIAAAMTNPAIDFDHGDADHPPRGGGDAAGESAEDRLRLGQWGVRRPG